MGRLRPAMLGLALLAAACAAWAGPLDEGRALYKAGKYAESAKRLEQATRQEPGNAKAWWQLNFAYNKLNRPDDALQAVQQAVKVDPSKGFASDPAKVDETLKRLEAKARPHQSGGNEGGRRGSQPSSASSGGITAALMSGDVYVAPGMNVDAARLQAVANSLKPTVVKFAVLNSRSGSSTLAREASRIRDYLNLGSGYVIAASRAGVSASSKQLSKTKLRDAVKQVAPMMETGRYTEGLEQLARSLVATRTAQTRSTGMVWFTVLLVGGGIVITVVALRSAANRRSMRARRSSIERKKTDIIAAISSLDSLEESLSPTAAARVREYRLSAGTKLDEAARIVVRARKDSELQRAEALLASAQGDIEGARTVASRPDRGPGGSNGATGAAPPVYAEAVRSSTDGTDWSSVPEEEKGVCFFCSRPSYLDELTPVTVKLEGERQKVLACMADLATIKTGAMPQIRAFEHQGRTVPWYAYPDYNPYNDYYGRGYGGGSLLSDMVTLSVIDHMFWSWHRPAWGWGWGGGYGMGYGGYTFYPDHHNYSDYSSERAASSLDTTSDAAGVDFLSSGSDVGGDRDAAGADFLGSDQS